MKTKIYYHHTDCGGVVYYANYLKFLEEARTEFLEDKGIFIKELIKNDSALVVMRQEIDYKSPAFYGDTIEVKTSLSNISRTKIEFEYRIINQHAKTISTAKTTMACVNSNLKPKAIPGHIQEILSRI